MGQGTSKAQEALTFGHGATAVHELPADSYEDDLILSHPEFYGFGSSPPPLLFEQSESSRSSLAYPSQLSIHSVHEHFERSDSGYASDDDDKLAKDFAYVDITYYDNNPRPARTVTETQPANNGKRFTFADVARTSDDPSMQNIDMSLQSLGSLSSNIGLLTMIRKLDLSRNQLTRLPDAIGHLHHLEDLSLARNHLTELPHTISYLTSLTELDVSHNLLTFITPCIGYLKKLHTMTLTSNQLVRLPTEIAGMSSLASLDMSHNPIRVLPAEISQLPLLRRLRLEACPLKTELVYELPHDPPSLLELCARTIIRHQIDTTNLPEPMVDYLASAKPCSSCHGPYFESVVRRGRFVDKADITVPLEYQLCSAHWTDENERLLSMFSHGQANCRIRAPRRPSLPLLQKQSTERFTLRRARPIPSVPGIESIVSTTEDDDASQKLSKWRPQRLKKVMNRNQSGFLSLTTKLKRPQRLEE
ncbi:Leucine-rich repeat-containing protein 58 [Apophysomyces sp. BC1034]|nr:Leucine-rich repeat-containing protein 58 [Apophysomyces sp. BC1015]KAG0179558.1 Leucine-rich repeat-containing protein 58 [Apophysomyces sp. BC1021]KAG0190707.1 Leucine-rich repeat-containing protein 58 [Apophysomyces sp. BC1034]